MTELFEQFMIHTAYGGSPSKQQMVQKVGGAVEPVESVESFEMVEVLTEGGGVGGSPPAAGWELTSGPKSFRNPLRNPPIRGFLKGTVEEIPF